jgi:hypothetical protein
MTRPAVSRVPKMGWRQYAMLQRIQVGVGCAACALGLWYLLGRHPPVLGVFGVCVGVLLAFTSWRRAKFASQCAEKPMLKPGGMGEISRETRRSGADKK